MAGLGPTGCSRWDWSVRHPVLRLSFGSGDFKQPGYLHQAVLDQLDGVADDAAIVLRYDSAPSRLRQLLKALHRQTGRRVVVLPWRCPGSGSLAVDSIQCRPGSADPRRLQR